jgi:hypothetical protein
LPYSDHHPLRSLNVIGVGILAIWAKYLFDYVFTAVGKLKVYGCFLFCIVYNFKKREDTSYIYVAIEPSRGSRLFVQCSKDYNACCHLRTPISSAGTLRITERYATAIPDKEFFDKLGIVKTMDSDMYTSMTDVYNGLWKERSEKAG